MIAIGCGGPPKGAASSPSAAATSSGTVAGGDSAAAAPTPGTSAPAAGAGSAAATNDPASAAGATASPTASTPPPAPAARPFAHNAEEATSLIDDAITSRSNELGQCVDAARARRKSPHAKLVVEVGIDEEGHMLGVTLPKKEKLDGAFTDCVFSSLRAAPFPKSHSGVITVRKTFEDKAVYR
jgi:hypothetical protein